MQVNLMMNIFAILLILILCAATGYGVLSFLIPADSRFESDRLEIYFVILISGVLTNSWVALILTELSLFSVTALSVFSAVVLISGWAWQQRSSHRPILSQQARLKTVHWQLGEGNYLPVWGESVFLVGWLVIAVLLFFRPHEHVWGAADIGVYINYAAHISQTGGIIINEPLLTDIPADLTPHFLSRAEASLPEWSFLSPALDVKDFSGRIYPSFYHLHSIWQSVGWSVNGLSAALMVAPMWGLLSTLCFYFLLRHLLPNNLFLLALIGLGGLTITALQVWFVRYGTTEPLTQLLFLTGFLAFCRWNLSGYQSWVWGLLAGVAWGATFLVRIDTFFIGIVPAVMLLLVLLNLFSWKNFFIFCAPFVFLAVHGTVHSILYSPEYISRLMGYMTQVAFGPGLFLVLGAGLAAVLTAAGTWFFRDYVLRLFTPVRFLISMAVVVYFLFSWFVRPYSGVAATYTLNGAPVESWNHENLIRLGWYLTPFGAWAAFVGVLSMLLKKRWTHWYVLIPGLFYVLFYTWNLRSNGAHIYVMRRYVPLVLPFLTISVLLLWGQLLAYRHKLVRSLGVILTIIWLAGLAWGTRGFASQVDYKGMADQLAVATADLPPNSIILFNQPDPVGVGDFVAMPMRFFHGHRTFVLRDLTVETVPVSLTALVDDWKQTGNPVFWVNLDEQNKIWPGAKFQQGRSYSVRLQAGALESVYHKKPVQVFPVIWDFQIVEIK
ncbi:MAG: hypothetical protein ACI9EW_000210 [Cellvibrionaceae bacterium]